MSKEILYGLAGIIIGILVIFFVVSVNNKQLAGMMGFRRMSATPTENGKVNSSVIDAHFIEQMIPHHEDAITMAKIAQEKATHQEIKTLAQNIITTQTSEIKQMKSWYKDWYGRDLPSDEQVMNVHGMMSNTSGMHMGMMGDDQDIETLKNSPEFDKTFIEEMIPHHQMAVMMASMLKDGTSRPEMKNLYDNIITAQTEEISQMRQWYKDWGYE